MGERFQFFEGIYLRTRLLKRVTFRLWKSFVLSRAKPLIGEIKHESLESFSSNVPAIILSSFNRFSDFLILTYLFQHKDLTFIGTRGLPNEKILNQLRAVNHVLYLDDNKIGYSFFKNFHSILCDYNRSVVISPEAAEQYAKHVAINPAVIVRIAMTASVPIIPVRFDWQEKEKGSDKGIQKCDIWVGKSIYISPRAEEFRDIFFKRRGARKFMHLPYDDLAEIGSRIFLKLKGSNPSYGASIPQEMGKRIF